MKSQSKLSDTPEADEFFRRGDEQLHVADSLQPTVSFDDSEVLTDPRWLRTPAQRRRRATLIKVVSLIMAFLTVGAAGAFVGTLKKNGERRATPSLLAARGAETPEAKAEVVTGSASALAVQPSAPSSDSLMSTVASDASEAASAEPAAPMTSEAVRAEPGVAVRLEPTPTSEVSAEAAPASPVPDDSATDGEAATVQRGPAEKSITIDVPKSSAGADFAGREPSDRVAASLGASATASGPAAASPEKKSANRSAAKSSGRGRAAVGRRQVLPISRKRVAKPEDVRATESEPPPSRPPSAKPEEYRPPTATFADE